MKKTFIILIALIVLLSLGIAGCAGNNPAVERTPVPTLIPATLPAPSGQTSPSGHGQCRVAALDLIGAWVKAGHPETDAFTFQAVDQSTCHGTYAADVQPLFSEPNLWFNGSIACASCHGENVANSAARMSLTSYAAILSGAGRQDQNSAGQNILDDGKGSWEKSQLYTMIFSRQMPMGRPADSPTNGPVILAGTK